MTEVKENLANRLKMFRINKKITTQDVASVLRCSEQTYDSYEKGETLIEIETLEFLYHMGCNLNWLITGKENINAENNHNADTFQIINEMTSTIKEQSITIKELTNTLNEQAQTIKTAVLKCSKPIVSGDNNVIGGNNAGGNSVLGEFQ